MGKKKKARAMGLIAYRWGIVCVLALAFGGRLV